MLRLKVSPSFMLAAPPSVALGATLLTVRFLVPATKLPSSSLMVSVMVGVASPSA